MVVFLVLPQSYNQVFLQLAESLSLLEQLTSMIHLHNFQISQQLLCREAKWPPSFLRIVEFQWFLMELSVLPWSILAISAHLFPSRVCAKNNIHSSPKVQSVLTILGLRWLCQRYRHCLPSLPLMNFAMKDQRCGPYLLTSRIRVRSYSSDHGFFLRIRYLLESLYCSTSGSSSLGWCLDLSESSVPFAACLTIFRNKLTADPIQCYYNQKLLVHGFCDKDKCFILFWIMYLSLACNFSISSKKKIKYFHRNPMANDVSIMIPTFYPNFICQHDNKQKKYTYMSSSSLLVYPMLILAILSQTSQQGEKNLINSYFKQTFVNFRNYTFLQVAMINHYDLITWKEVKKQSHSQPQSNSSLKQFNFFNAKEGEGIIQFRFVRMPIIEFPHVNLIIMELRDPYYIDGKISFLRIPVIRGFDPQTQSWKGQGNCYVTLVDHTDIVTETKEVNCEYDISNLQGKITSDTFSISIQRHDPEYHNLLPFVLLIPHLLLFFCVCRIKVQPEQVAKKLSILTIGLTLNMLIFISISELYQGVLSMNTPQFWLVLTGGISFLCSIQFTYSFLPVLSRMTAFEYLQFYLLTFGYIWLVFNHGTDWKFILANSLTMLPQIVFNELSVMKAVFDPWIILSVFLPQIYVLYLKGVPRNLLSWQPQIWLCVGIICLIALQVAILYCQYKYTKRFLIHRFFMRKDCIRMEVSVVNSESSADMDECSICLLSLGEDPEQAHLNSTDTQLATWETKIVKTPCSHKFHMSCLSIWMEQKLECPIDRYPLLPIIV